VQRQKLGDSKAPWRSQELKSEFLWYILISMRNKQPPYFDNPSRIPHPFIRKGHIRVGHGWNYTPVGSYRGPDRRQLTELTAGTSNIYSLYIHIGYTRNLLYRNAFNWKTCYYGQTLAVLSLPTYILLAIPDTSIYRTGLAEGPLTGGHPHTKYPAAPDFEACNTPKVAWYRCWLSLIKFVRLSPWHKTIAS